MDQTVESINLAKMAEAAIIVAINKCDKAKTNPVKYSFINYGMKSLMYNFFQFYRRKLLLNWRTMAYGAKK